MNGYAAPWWLPGGHLQTIYPSLHPPPRAALQRERWETPDGDFIDVDFAGERAAPRLLVLFHGLEGCSDSHYARAFAAQALGVLRELPNRLNGFTVPDDRLNPNGGAVAIGHPFGSSGTRYVLTLSTELSLREKRYGILGVCVGSGQGVALVLENPDAR